MGKVSLTYSLDDMQRAFKKALVVRKSESLLPALQGSKDEKMARLGFYQRNVLISLVDSLRAIFPLFEKAIGTENFIAISRLFVENHPPKKAELYNYGAGFPEFCQTFLTQKQDSVWLWTLTQFEWLMNESFFSKGAPFFSKTDLETITAEQFGAGFFMLHPSVRLYAPSISLDGFLQDKTEEEMRALAQQSPVEKDAFYFIVCLSSGVIWDKLSKEEFAFLKAMEKKQSIEEALSGIGDDFIFPEALVHFLSLGCFTALHLA